MHVALVLYELKLLLKSSGQSAQLREYSAPGVRGLAWRMVLERGGGGGQFGCGYGPAAV